MIKLFLLLGVSECVCWLLELNVVFSVCGGMRARGWMNVNYNKIQSMRDIIGKEDGTGKRRLNDPAQLCCYE